MTCILQISSGQGPAECRRFVPLLAEIIKKDATKKSISCLTLSDYSPSEELVASIRFAIAGENLPLFRQSWEGTLQWIWKSDIRPHWPRKNWFVKVTFFDFQPDISKTFKSSDLKIDTCRASGAGGQHINTTDSAVRVTHLPSGIVCTASEERSQIRNRELALLRLQDRLNMIAEQQHADQNEKMWLDHYHLERGDPIKVFTGMPPRLNH